MDKETDILLSETVVESMERHRVPGVAVGIIHHGEEHVAGFGVTNVDHPLPVDADTLFQIGSITKTITGTAVMRLVEMGKLDLDIPIRTYLPDLRLSSEEVAAQVTMRHLLTHTAGWVGNYFDDLGSGDDALAKIVTKMADLPQLTPLGAVWSYNNSGFYLAGRVIEVVIAKTYEAAVKELVLDPLGMTMSFFFPADVITYRVAVGHNVLDEGPVVTRPWALPRTAHPIGGIISSVKSLLRYAHFHIGDGIAADGIRLRTPEPMALMRSPQAPAGNMADAIGITWMLRDVCGTRIVEHGGGTNGQLSALMMVPERGFAIAVLTNADRGVILCHEVTKWALHHYLDIEEPGAVPLKLPEETLISYVGRYSSALAEVELSLRDDGLIMQVTYKGGFPTKESPPPPSPPPVRLAFYDDDCVVALDDPMKDARGEFLRNPDGSIAWFRILGIIRAPGV